MPLVGMKPREMLGQQIDFLGQFVEVDAVNPDGSPMIDQTTGKQGKAINGMLLTSLLALEMLINIRDILLQLALSPIWPHTDPMSGHVIYAPALRQNNPIFVAKDMPSGG